MKKMAFMGMYSQDSNGGVSPQFSETEDCPQMSQWPIIVDTKPTFAPVQNVSVTQYIQANYGFDFNYLGQQQQYQRRQQRTNAEEK